MVKYAGLMLGVIVVMSGCSSTSVKENAPANVTSEPSAAAVYANGLKIGETPLRADLFKVFPASWVDWVYQATGVLIVKKQGCKDFTLKVNDYILSQPIHARLECHAVEKSQEDVPVRQTAPMIEKKVDTHLDEAIEERLRKLEALYKKGLITTDEYKATRKRILSEI